MAEAEQKEPVISDEEQKLVKFVHEKLLAPAKTWKFYYAGDKHEKWLDDIKWYKGKQWDANRSKEKSSVFFNRLFSLIQRELPFMTDNPPRMFVYPTEIDNIENKIFADIAEKWLFSTWVDRDMELKYPESIMHSKQLGTTFLEPFWNPELADGLGDADCRVPDPLHCFPLPYTSQLSSGEGIIEARPVSLGWVRKNYKEGWRVKPDGEMEDVPDRARETNGEGSGLGLPIQSSDIGSTDGYQADRTDYLAAPNGGKSMTENDLKRVLLVKAVIKDGTIEEYEDKDDKGEKIKKSKYKYPYGRVITTAGKVVLNDEPYQFDCFPGYIDGRNYINPGEFWGESDITQIKEGQRELNKFQACVIDAMRRDVYKQHFIQHGSGIEIDEYIRHSDAVYETKVPSPVQETGQWSLPAQIFGWGDILERSIEKTAGVQEYTPPSGGQMPSGRALGEYRELTLVRLRQKIRNAEYMVRKLAEAWLKMMLKNYTNTRIMQFVNKGAPKEQEYVYLFRQEVKTPKGKEMSALIEEEKKNEIIPGTEQIDPATKKPIPDSGVKKYKYVLNLAKVTGGFNIKVATNSTVSTSQIAVWEQTFAMFQAGLVDQQAALEAADYPDREAIIKRMAQNAAAQAQQAEKMVMLQTELEKAKLQVAIQTNQLDNQTKLQIADMNNQTKAVVEANKAEVDKLKAKKKEGGME